jgi:hypothetical protein
VVRMEVRWRTMRRVYYPPACGEERGKGTYNRSAQADGVKQARCTVRSGSSQY